MTDAKPLVFTEHAMTAIHERLLQSSWVEQAAYEPEWTEPDRRDPEVERRFRSIPEYDNRFLRMACVETAREIRIVVCVLQS